MANHDIGVGQLDEQRSSPEGMLQREAQTPEREEQTPEQEESQYQEQGESDLALVAQVTAQEPEHEHRDMQAQAMAQQDEMSQEQQAEELVEPPMGQPDDAVPGSAPAEPSEPEAVPVLSEPLGAAGDPA